MFKPEIEIKKFEMVDVITTSSEEEELPALLGDCD